MALGEIGLRTVGLWLEALSDKAFSRIRPHGRNIKNQSFSG